jgi:hypothetical protein
MRPSRPLYPREKDPVPMLQETGWTPLTVAMDSENLPPPGFDAQTVQPVASQYADWAIPDHVGMSVRN